MPAEIAEPLPQYRDRETGEYLHPYHSLCSETSLLPAGAVRMLCGFPGRLLARVVARREQLNAPRQQCAMLPIFLAFDMNQVARTQVDEKACCWPAIALR